MKIAIIGSGISGLVCAHLLDEAHEVTLFEAEDYIGGHTNTHDVDINGQSFAVDTGFIVYNNRTYPNFIKLMDKLNVSFKPTTMGFSVTDKKQKLEYCTLTLNTFFSQRKNILNPRFYLFIRQIVRFNKITNDLLKNDPDKLAAMTLTEFLAEYKFDDRFARWYILPMIAAVWSSSFETAGQYPMLALLRFLSHHGLLATHGQPIWQVIKGGSREYVRALLEQFNGDIKLNAPVSKVEDDDSGICVTANGEQHTFDRVIFACHSDQALAMLAEPSDAERVVLGGIKYQQNETVLHTDTKLLPSRERAWTAWNYRVTDDDAKAASLTYNMNILQGLDAPETFCVTLNQTDDIDPNKILKVIQYTHPVYTQETVAAQARWGDISGHDKRKFFCGAYWFNGFHEDGVNSALRVCEAFGEQL